VQSRGVSSWHVSGIRGSERWHTLALQVESGTLRRSLEKRVRSTNLFRRKKTRANFLSKVGIPSAPQHLRKWSAWQRRHRDPVGASLAARLPRARVTSTERPRGKWSRCHDEAFARD
jgi:hypothetical protein